MSLLSSECVNLPLHVNKNWLQVQLWERVGMFYYCQELNHHHARLKKTWAGKKLTIKIIFFLLWSFLLSFFSKFEIRLDERNLVVPIGFGPWSFLRQGTIQQNFRFITILLGLYNKVCFFPILQSLNLLLFFKLCGQINKRQCSNWLWTLVFV